MTPEEFIKYFANLKLRIQDASRKELPLIAGNKAVQLFKHNFQEQGFFGEKWLEVKRRMPQATATTSKGKKKKKKATGAASKRPILTGATGNLGRSIQMRTADGEVTVMSDLPYSAAHNLGTTTAGRGHRTTIPQRCFIGNHPIDANEMCAYLHRIIFYGLDLVFQPE